MNKITFAVVLGIVMVGVMPKAAFRARNDKS